MTLVWDLINGLGCFKKYILKIHSCFKHLSYLLTESYLIGGDQPEVVWRHRALRAVKAREEEQEGLLVCWRLFQTRLTFDIKLDKNTIITNV